MSSNPALSAVKRQELESLIAIFYERIRKILPEEAEDSLAEIRNFLDGWEANTGLRSYWDDWKKDSLLISAERAATIRALRGSFTASARATPNSLRDVEPSVTVRIV